MAEKDMTVQDVLAELKNLGDTMRAEIAEASKRRAEIAIDKSGLSADQIVQRQLLAQRAANVPGEVSLGHVIKWLKAGRNDADYVCDMARKHGFDGIACSIVGVGKDGVQFKAMGGDSLTAGGAMVPVGQSDMFIELLEKRAVVRGMGVPSIPMPNGNLSIPFANTGPTAAYIGESENITATEGTVGQLNLSAKKLVCAVPQSNELLNDSSERSSRVIGNMTVGKMAAKEDLAFIRGDGASDTPMGMRYWSASASQTTTTAGTSVANITTDLNNLVLLQESDDVPRLSPKWLFAPRTRAALMSKRDGNNNLVWATEMAGGTLMGYPFFVSNQIPITLTSTDSEIYLVDVDHQVIADTSMLELAVSSEASYYNGSALVSAFARDESVLRAVSRHDYACTLRGKGVSVITNIGWTP